MNKLDFLIKNFIGIKILIALSLCFSICNCALAQSVLKPQITKVSAQYNAIEIAWNEVDGMEAYEIIVVGKKQHQYYIGNNHITLTEEIEPGVVYSIYIRGFTFDENEHSEQTSVCLLTPPLALPATTITSNSFTANWIRKQKIDEYYLYVATDSTFSQIIPQYNGIILKAATKKIENLIPDSLYYYRLKTIDLMGNEHFSNIMKVKTENIRYK